MIEISHLSKRYGALTAVDDVSFDVRAGEVLGFLGPNGAGKSTTMKMITGFLAPTSGTVRVCAWSSDEGGSVVAMTLFHYPGVGRSMPDNAAAARTRSALLPARVPSGRTSVSSRPTRMPRPRRTARASTVHVARPSPWWTRLARSRRGSGSAGAAAPGSG